MKGGKVTNKNVCAVSVCAGACSCVLTHGSPGAVCVCAVALWIQVDVGSSHRGPGPVEPSCASGPHTHSCLWVGKWDRDRDRVGTVKHREGDRWEISRGRGEKIGEREATGFQNICDVNMHNSVAIGNHS